MEESALIKKARHQINSVKGRSLSVSERATAAVDLAATLLEEAQRVQTRQEKDIQDQLSGMMKDPLGKVFTTAITDQCFRSQQSSRAADQIVFIIQKYGIPAYFNFSKKLAMKLFLVAGKSFSSILIPLVKHLIRKETSNVILPGEEKQLKKHIARRQIEQVRVNLNHLGEAILGEEEAVRRLQTYLNDLSKPEVDYISIKISTIYSQINLLAWEETIEAVANRLRLLYRSAIKNSYPHADGSMGPKFVNLDMEEYRDLHLTLAVFKKVLDEPEFFHYKAGIVLQAYLPDSYLLQQELTVWAMQRIARGGAPIKIRIVKGANLAMEQFEAAVRLWPQAPYNTKAEVDANYKRMVEYGCLKNHAQAVHLGIASHNLFDIAYALLLRSEQGVEKEVSFEMLEGMADHMRRVVQQISGGILLYCPAANKEEFQNAVAYLVRRLDENTAPENFLRQAFDLQVHTEAWKKQAALFTESCASISQVSYLPQRQQNRFHEECSVTPSHFTNEPDTDWSLLANRKWGQEILKNWQSKKIPPIPLSIGNEFYPPTKEHCAVGEDPNQADQFLYQYALATSEQVDTALNIAKEVEQNWAQTPIQMRCELLWKIAQGLKKQRDDLIGAMVKDTGKTIVEADIEISEAIDFANYYAFNLREWASLTDIQWKAKGTVLVAPPWNFPCSIPAGGILAALATGNCVIFKPAPEAVLVGWQLVQIFWEAGVNRKVLQFINCVDEPVGSQLIQDPRISTVILTGATATAKLFLKLRNDLDLMAETGGKNTMVITALSDRDLAIKDLVHSAFGHAGQKCSACSLAILEAEVYDDPHFHQQLKDAAASLHVGSSWDLQTRVNPLIRPAGSALMRGLTQLDEGEEWLLEPKQDTRNPHLWSPGIKLGVKPNSFTFQTELFGPVLGLVRAPDFNAALDLMNQTPYGLTAGIHSLDEREQEAWLKRIEAGNCYINRTTTGAVVERQPFGGCKESSFGRGSKAGGPNYLTQLMIAEQISLPEHRAQPNKDVQALMQTVDQAQLIPSDDQEFWRASCESYAFFWLHYFSRSHDPSLVRGQDNLQIYVSHPKVSLILHKNDKIVDILCEIAAALTCRTTLEIISENSSILEQLKQLTLPSFIQFSQESTTSLIKRLEGGQIKRVRLLQKPSKEVQATIANAAGHINFGKVLANGRLELLNFLREVSVSRDYHRYGNLGDRENEKRAPLPNQMDMKNQFCSNCECHER